MYTIFKFRDLSVWNEGTS